VLFGGRDRVHSPWFMDVRKCAAVLQSCSLFLSQAVLKMSPLAVRSGGAMGYGKSK
jgi:hypothetical protein